LEKEGRLLRPKWVVQVKGSKGSPFRRHTKSRITTTSRHGLSAKKVIGRLDQLVKSSGNCVTTEIRRRESISCLIKDRLANVLCNVK